MNVKMVRIVCLISVLVFSWFYVGAGAAKETEGPSPSAETKTGSPQEEDDVYSRALEEMAPLAIGWTSDARDRVIEMDDGTSDPRDLATMAVRRTSLPYRDELEKAWGKVPNDGVNTPKTEMDRFEENLIDRITDLVMEWRSSRNEHGGAVRSREQAGQPRE